MSGNELRKIIRGEADLIDILNRKIQTISEKGELEFE